MSRSAWSAARGRKRETARPTATALSNSKGSKRSRRLNSAPGGIPQRLATTRVSQGERSS